MHISFVILHYMIEEYTVNCVQSILDNCKGEEYSVIVVDNGSTNDSCARIKKRFQSDSRIIVLETHDNLGFAKGNNVGYAYAREKLKSDFIIIANNDTLFQQNDFFQIMIDCFHKSACGVMGPDIVNIEGQHQNPFRIRSYTYQDAKKARIHKKIYLYYYELKKILHLEAHVQILENMFAKKTEQGRSTIDYKKEQTDVVLHGSCLIFTPIYLEKEKEAFCSKTFMYGEEDILAFHCKREGYPTLYNPNLRIRHLEGAVTKRQASNTNEKNIFFCRCAIKSLDILIDMMKIKQ